LPEYKSSLYRKYEESLKHRQEEAVKEKERERERIDKMRAYVDYVKSNFVPEVDEDKRRSLEEELARHKQGPRQPGNPHEIGNQYMKIAKGMLKRSTRSEHISTSNSQASQSKTVLSEAPKVQNYLNDERVKRALKARLSENQAIEAIMAREDLDLREKRELVMAELERLEARVLRQAEGARLSKSQQNRMLDEMYLESVKAKLALL
jgi:hypothetical protein